MKVTYTWLQDFADIRIPPAALAEKLTMAGLEVKSVEEKAGDAVFEIEITSNRPDWLSVLGVAREAAALTGSKVKEALGSPKTRARVTKGERWPIKIEDAKGCPAYTARIIRGVKVAPSPRWLTERLEKVGVRSVNNIVDITNYVLYEFGEPLHAFDLDTLEGRAIVVRRAKNNEKVVSIDGVTHDLDQSVLVIADARRPVAIAGVMGAKNTEVTDTTANVLLEAAIFDPVVVRRGRQKLGMNSDAAYRFERGVDPLAVERASQRAAEMIVEIAGGTCTGFSVAGSTVRTSPTVSLAAAHIERYLGKNLPVSEAARILSALGFGIVRKTKQQISVRVPSWRSDVRIEMDLIEEIARIHGFDRFPSTLPSVLLRQNQDASGSMVSRIRDILVGLGLCEAVTHSLIDRASLSGYWQDQESLIAVANPLSQEQELMRPLLMPSLVRAIAHNVRQQQPFIGLFEIARTYRRTNAKVHQTYALGIALCGTRSWWFGPAVGHVQDEAGILHLKGALDTLFGRIGIALNRIAYQASADTIAITIDGAGAGFLREVPSGLLEPLDIKHKRVFAAELLLEEEILPRASLLRHFDAARVPRYPGIVRDLTLEVREETTLEAIMAAAAALSEPLLVGAEFSAYYKGEKVPAGFKRITISCKYRAEDRTLTEEEVIPVHERLVKSLQERFQAQVR